MRHKPRLRLVGEEEERASAEKEREERRGATQKSRKGNDLTDLTFAHLVDKVTTDRQVRSGLLQHTFTRKHRVQPKHAGLGQNTGIVFDKRPNTEVTSGLFFAFCLSFGSDMM